MNGRDNDALESRRSTDVKVFLKPFINEFKALAKVLNCVSLLFNFAKKFTP